MSLIGSLNVAIAIESVPQPLDAACRAIAQIEQCWRPWSRFRSMATRMSTAGRSNQSINRTPLGLRTFSRSATTAGNGRPAKMMMRRCLRTPLDRSSVIASVQSYAPINALIRIQSRFDQSNRLGQAFDRPSTAKQAFETGRSS